MSDPDISPSWTFVPHRLPNDITIVMIRGRVGIGLTSLLRLPVICSRHDEISKMETSGGHVVCQITAVMVILRKAQVGRNPKYLSPSHR